MIKSFAEERYDICKKCDQSTISPLGLKCKKCGCFLLAKTKVKFMHCPIEKW